MNVTYTGSGASATISIFFDTATDQYRYQVVEATNVLVDSALGLGRHGFTVHRCVSCNGH